MGDDEPELSAAALGSKHLRYLEASLKGMVDEVVKLLSDPEFKEKFLNYQEEETGHSALHKAASAGKLEVAKINEDERASLHRGKIGLCEHCESSLKPVLLEAGADPNLDDAQLATCLHVACSTYANDETGDFCFEDMVPALVEGGALAFRDRNKELPNVGEDAATAVEKALEKAIRLGKKESDERDKARKEAGERAFGNAMQKHLTNASTCVGVVGVKSFAEPGSTGK